MNIFSQRRARLALGPLAMTALWAHPDAANAQSSLSGQGFGYPPGQLSTRALALGGANAELDPVSPRNPAAVSSWGSPGLHLQYDPEFRRVSVADAGDRTMNARFPLISGATRVGSRLAVSASISTLLDRTWSTRSSHTEMVEGSELTTTNVFESAGGMNDVRLALAWIVVPTFRVGVAGHAITGENRVTLRSTFSDSTFTPLAQQTEVSYSGTTFSGGITWRPFATWAVGASGRMEGALRGRRAGTTVTSARVPSRAGLSLSYTGITGAVISASGDWQNWTALDALGSDDVRTRDTQELSVGAEIDGPRVRGNTILLRAGGRWRDLPFAAGGSWVTETAFGAGVGVPLANVAGLPRATFDLATQRASRSGPTGVRETAWTLSIGLTVRP
jgi:hypothetical protein